MLDLNCPPNSPYDTALSQIILNQIPTPQKGLFMVTDNLTDRNGIPSEVVRFLQEEAQTIEAFSEAFDSATDFVI